MVDPAIVVQPHLDDGPLSVGQMMAGRPDCILTTVFAGTPTEGDVSTAWDKNCGWSSAAIAMGMRKMEDEKAARILSATTVWLDFLDHQYREVGLTNHLAVWDDTIADALLDVARPLVEQLGHITIVGPMGLGHPDHHMTRRAVELAAKALGSAVELWLYEDAPYRVLEPDSVPDALGWWRGMGWDPVIGFLGTGPLAVKRRAVEAYKSQVSWPPEFEGLHAVLVPERLWRAWPTTGALT